MNDDSEKDREFLLIQEKLKNLDTSKKYDCSELQQLIHEFNDPRFFKQQKELSRQSRIWSFVFQELIPLVNFARSIDESGCKLEIFGNLKSDSAADGIIHHEKFYPNGKEIQCVSASCNHEEVLRMEHLEKFGRAPAYGKINYSGNKNKRNIKETHCIAHSKNDPKIRANFKLDFGHF